MQLCFENELGKIELSGSGGSVWRIVETDGLCLAPKSFHAVTYAGQNGQETLSVTTGARTVTIRGDIKNKGTLSQELARAARIFNQKGTLKIKTASKKRKTECYVSTFEVGERNKAAQPFLLQMVADDPHFTDFCSNTVSVFERIDKVSSPFLLPMALTERTIGATIINSGDVKTQPVFYVHFSADSIGEVTLCIENETTGARLGLLVQAKNGEILTIDIPERRITSNVKGVITECISQDTFLSDFYLQTGTNRILAQTDSISASATVILEYTNKYIEAVN